MVYFGRMKTLSKARRRFTAKIVADLGKTMFGIGFASYFFEKFPWFLRVFLAVVCFILLVGSVYIEPKESENA